MDYGLLTIFSVLFGLIAVVIPLFNSGAQGSIGKVLLSFMMCLAAICCQIAYQNYLVQMQDWTALADTSGTVLYACLTLVILTVLMNVVSLVRVKRNTMN